MIVLDLGWILNPMIGVLMKERRGRFETHSEEKTTLRMEVEIGMSPLQVKEPEDIQNHRRSERGTVCSPPEGNNPANTLILNFSRTVRE